jgi:hypothetical protein
MSYLAQYATRRSASARVDERIVLNLPEFDGGAHIRVFVENTSAARFRRRPPSPRSKLRIADCFREVRLEFPVDSAEERENSLHKIETLIAALERFRDGLAAEAELRAQREQAGSVRLAA